MPPVELLQGTLKMMVLQTLAAGPANGYEIAKAIEQRSQEMLRVDHGSLYPALRRLETQSLIAAEWMTSPTGRQARYYSLTPAGHAQIAIEHSRWETLVAAINLVMRSA